MDCVDAGRRLRLVTYNVAGYNDDWDYRRLAMERTLWGDVCKYGDSVDLHVFHLQESKVQSDIQQQEFFRLLVKEGGRARGLDGPLIEVTGGGMLDIQSLAVMKSNTLLNESDLVEIPDCGEDAGHVAAIENCRVRNHAGGFQVFAGRPGPLEADRNGPTSKTLGGEWRPALVHSVRVIGDKDAHILFINLHLFWEDGGADRRHKQILCLKNSVLPDLYERFRIRPENATVVITGDLNGGNDEDFYKELTENMGFIDAFQGEVNASRTFPSGSSHAEYADDPRPKTLDYIFYKGPHLRPVVESRALVGNTPVDAARDTEHFPSDHFGLQIVFDVVTAPSGHDDAGLVASSLDCIVDNQPVHIFNADYNEEFLFVKNDPRWNTLWPTMHPSSFVGSFFASGPSPRDVYTWKPSYGGNRSDIDGNATWQITPASTADPHSAQEYFITIHPVGGGSLEYLCAVGEEGIDATRRYIGTLAGREPGQPPDNTFCRWYIKRLNIANAPGEFAIVLADKLEALYARTNYTFCNQRRREVHTLKGSMNLEQARWRIKSAS